MLILVRQMALQSIVISPHFCLLLLLTFYHKTKYIIISY